jgi:hypothetical protein
MEDRFSGDYGIVKSLLNREEVCAKAPQGQEVCAPRTRLRWHNIENKSIMINTFRNRRACVEYVRILESALP